MSDATRDDWKCDDRSLGSYSLTLDGNLFHAQRTFCDAFQVWYGGEIIGTAPRPANWRHDAYGIAQRHAAKLKEGSK